VTGVNASHISKFAVSLRLFGWFIEDFVFGLATVEKFRQAKKRKEKKKGHQIYHFLLRIAQTRS
jgi:hypothetical protein